MDTKNFLAFDFGATGGRAVLATIENGTLHMRDLVRFPNRIIQIGDKFYWNIYTLYEALLEGLHAAVRENIKIESVGIDTWGVDFVYVGKDGSFLGLPRAYRDPYTNGMPDEYFKIIPKKEVYDLTGIQIMNFNSLFQLFAAKKENSSALEAADSVLFMPDALSYMLTGKKVCEYTIASTSQILNPRTKQFENKLLEAAGVKPELLQPIIMPGEVIGTLTDEIAESTGAGKIPVVAVAGHDTGSAVAAVPADNERFAYLSSGTWSLMGIEVKDPIIDEEAYAMNFTNEGGVAGTTRFLKNITGMWLLEQFRRVREKEGIKYTYAEIIEMAESADPFRSFIDPDHPYFAGAGNMPESIRKYCVETKQPEPRSDAEFIRLIFESLALKYKYVLNKLMKIAPFTIEKLHVIGGGSQNKLMNQLTADSIGMPVIAGPTEATAAGNVMMQAYATGLVKDLSEIRQVINKSVTPEVYLPKDTSLWENAYDRFVGLIEK